MPCWMLNVITFSPPPGGATRAPGDRDGDGVNSTASAATIGAARTSVPATLGFVAGRAGRRPLRACARGHRDEQDEHNPHQKIPPSPFPPLFGRLNFVPG